MWGVSMWGVSAQRAVSQRWRERESAQKGSSASVGGGSACGGCQPEVGGPAQRQLRRARPFSTYLLSRAEVDPVLELLEEVGPGPEMRLVQSAPHGHQLVTPVVEYRPGRQQTECK